jgi:hypothetical protein
MGVWEVGEIFSVTPDQLSVIKDKEDKVDKFNSKREIASKMLALQVKSNASN